MVSNLFPLVSKQIQNLSVLWLEFEEVLLVAGGLLFLLLYLFYFKYPVNKD